MTVPSVIGEFKGTHASFQLYSDRVVYVRLNDGLNLDEEVGHRHIAEMQRFVGDGPYIAVVDCRGLAYAPFGGRQAVRDDISDFRLATALIVDTRVMDYVVRQYLEEAEYPVENATFENEAAALAWAHDQIAQLATDE
jgi:hypothetical protein